LLASVACYFALSHVSRQGFVIVCICLLVGGLSGLLVRRFSVREESLLVIQELGVQLTVKYADGREKSKFIDRAKIKAVIINEGVTMHRVVFYMAFVVEGSDCMIVAFEHLRPRLDALLRVYRGTRAAVFGEEEDHS
ncbi:unnamed protein product, partial [Phaeothamnion confervicola]